MKAEVESAQEEKKAAQEDAEKREKQLREEAEAKVSELKRLFTAANRQTWFRRVFLLSKDYSKSKTDRVYKFAPSPMIFIQGQGGDGDEVRDG